MSNPNFGAARLGAFVHAAVHRDVGVLVNDPGRDVLPAAVDFHGRHTFGQQAFGVEVGTHGHQRSVVEQNVRIFENALLLARPNRGVSDPHGLLRQALRQAVGGEWIHDAGKVHVRIRRTILNFIHGGFRSRFRDVRQRFFLNCTCVGRSVVADG